jgi:hypothetical protein
MMLFSMQLIAQEDLLKELEESQPPTTDYVLQTFKGTRLVNGHSIETKGRGDLEFIFAHRFGAINQGLYELYGLDEAQVRIGLDYGLTEDFSASIGRNSLDKSLDGYIKYKLARQRSGTNAFPFSITGLGGIVYKASPKKDQVPEGFNSIDRIAYVGQLLIARKISSRLSLQLMPTMIHKNAVDKLTEDNDQFAIGFGGRVKLTKGVALTSEYYHRLNAPATKPFYNTLGFGIDIETGGHVFQLVLTNTMALTERAFITETEGDFFDGDIHFGFNVTRTFHLRGKK